MVLIYSAPLEKWRCIYKKCSAQCCQGGREVTAGDVRRIAKATGFDPASFAELHDEKGLFRLKSKANGCIFLRSDFSCKLHGKEAKPLLCRMYPFKFDGIIYSDEIVLKVKAVDGCPGFGKGKKLNADFEANIEELGNRFVKEIKDYLKLKHEGKEAEEILRTEAL